MLLTENMVDVFIINGKDKESVYDKIIACQAKIEARSAGSLNTGHEVEMEGFPPPNESHVTFSVKEVCTLDWSQLF